MTTSLLLPNQCGEASQFSSRPVILYLHTGKRLVNKYRKFVRANSAQKFTGILPNYAGITVESQKEPEVCLDKP
ncbi:MAG: hypothetical protein RL066_682 [Actinomycetota bacterium]|jgi:hypothetical protein